MKSLTKAVIKQLSTYHDDDISKELSKLYEKVLDELAVASYPKGVGQNSLMCGIHDYFKEGHNCVACNLNVYNSLLLRYLSNFKNLADIHLTSTNFHLLLYLLVERYKTYFEIIQLQESYRLKHFHVFQKITCWANFLKHPKAFMFAHHAFYWIKGLEYNSEHWFYNQLESAKKHNKLIDDKFVKEFYFGFKNNNKLDKLLSKNEEFVVVFPNPLELIKEFITAQNKFVLVIKENEIVREILDNKATIRDFFENEESMPSELK